MSRPPKEGAPGKAETRDALIAAAAEEFAECGLEGASLNAICARAGFTRGAFYVHFRDREDLIVAVMDRTIGGFVDALTSAPADDGEALERILTTVAFGIASSTQIIRGTNALQFHHVLAACAMSKRVGDRYVAVLSRAQEGVERAVVAAQRVGKARTDLDAQVVAELLISSTLGLIASTQVGLTIDAVAIGQSLLKIVAHP